MKFAISVSATRPPIFKLAGRRLISTAKRSDTDQLTFSLNYPNGPFNQKYGLKKQSGLQNEKGRGRSAPAKLTAIPYR